jgi:predicted nucleic acid-binding Zn ribbon protein
MISTYICIGCGKAFIPKETNRTKFCSRECAFKTKAFDPKKAQIKRLIARLRRLKACRYCGKKTIRFKSCYGCRGEKARRDAKEHNKRKVGEKPERKCPECGKFFQPDYGDKRTVYCSKKCNEKYEKHLQRRVTRMKRKRIPVKLDRFADLEIYERDDWICKICLKPTNRKVAKNHPHSPTIDHILPFAKGGGHTRENVQCAHRICNSLKGDS